MIEIPQREPTNDRLTIQKNGISYFLPVPWGIDGAGDIEYRLKAEERAFSHGATVSGDKHIKSRNLDIKLHVKAETAAEHDKLANEIIGKFQQQDYMLVAGRLSRAYNVAGMMKTKHKFIKSFKQRFSEITVTLLLADPFRYAAQPAKTTVSLSDTANAVQLYNPGSIDTPLAITLRPAVSMNDATIHHVETGRSCRIRDSLLTNPAALTADTKEGTVRRGTFNAINTFSGQFLTALPGLNRYEVTSAAGEIEIAFTARWLI
ncbi:MAG: phage tail family protein [Acidaminococcales bacterium]|jgi:phage-related protein|nr:phage tail family protein [Acidaminococcales bacterium]